jgi:tRNA-specific 2-thiouridylase
MPKRVVIGMSGGVDSSVAAFLLKQDGYDVIGLFMRNWDSTTNQDVLGNPTLSDDMCPQEKDYNDAKRVCDHLDIPLYRVDFIEEYWRDVFTYFLDEYKKGRTPNPDIMCNKYIKFDAFVKHASQFNPDFIAMGHYARVKRTDNTVQLLRGVDQNKDQTYFLSQLTKAQLKNALFPVGDYQKKAIREIAIKHDIPTATKKDSTGICFIGEREFSKFLNNYLPAQPGNMVTLDGDIIGEHTGLMHYTIGQRKGLGIGGSKAYDNKPWFVVGKDLEKNILYVGQGFHNPALYSTHCTLEDVNIIDSNQSIDGLSCTAKFRYRQQDIAVTIKQDNDQTTVFFKDPVRAVTPGQSCVFYDGDVCLGGGIIKDVFHKDTKRPY